MQLRYTVLFTAIFYLVQSQRPWHAGSSGSSDHTLKVLPQYIEEQAAALASQTQNKLGNPEMQGAPGGYNTLGNRIGEGDANTIPPVYRTSTIRTIQISLEDLPVDAHGDIDLVNRIMTWPREKQPFWFINWQAIQAHRGDSKNMAQSTEMQPNIKSF